MRRFYCLISSFLKIFSSFNFFSLPLFPRLHDEMKKAKEEGWTSINRSKLVLKRDYTDVTSVIDVETRSSVNPKTIFLKILSEPFLQHLAECTNEDVRYNSESKAGPKNLFDKRDIIDFVAMVLHVCGKRIDSFKDFLNDPDRQLGMSIRKYNRFSKHLNFRGESLVQFLNEGIQQTLQPGGHGVLDESMIPWRGDSSLAICIPRKPKDTGLRAYALCFCLDTTGQPVCYRFLPELQRPCISGRDILDHMVRAVPEHYIFSVTADSFFASVNFLEAHPDFSITLAISKATFPLYKLLSHKMQHHQVRIFRKGSVTLTLWLDGDLVLTASNMFKEANIPRNEREGRIRGERMIQQTPLLPTNKIYGLQQLLSHEELKKMASKMGLSTQGSSLELAFRIGGRLPPSPEPPSDPQPASYDSTDTPQGDPDSEEEPEDPDSKKRIQDYASQLKTKNSLTALKALCLAKSLNTCSFFLQPHPLLLKLDQFRRKNNENSWHQRQACEKVRKAYD